MKPWTLKLIVDLFMLSAAYWLAFMVRHDWDPSFPGIKRQMFTWPYVVVLQYIILTAFGVPRFAWRYVAMPEVRAIAQAVGVSALVLAVVRLVAAPLMAVDGYAQYAVVPFGVIVADACFVFLSITGVRAFWRLLTENEHSPVPRERQIQTMLVGAGSGGVTVAKEIARHPRLGLRAVGFLDDDPYKWGHVIHGIPVLGSTDRLAEMCSRHEAEQVLVTITHASGQSVRRIVERCERAGVPVKIIPRLHEIVGGRFSLQRMREVAIEDLLRREPVTLQGERIAQFIAAQRVLVTGAGGSIGAELCRQVARHGPESLWLVERSETALFEIHHELATDCPNVALSPCLVDVTDASELEGVFVSARPHIVFHAAAHKHVPMMELHPAQAVRNNIRGTQCVADLADRYRASCFVNISTDKAVNPTSVMGATKRVAELYIQALAARSFTAMMSVRFGNVLGSSGSVVPIFRRQIAAGGPVTVTHPEMRRYFMTIPEASQLVLQAAVLGQGGEVFVLDMGEPVRILDLANDVIRLSGFEPEVDIEVRITGLRPGEKLYEELVADAEEVHTTEHPKVRVGKVRSAEWAPLREAIEELLAADTVAMGKLLQHIVPEYQRPDAVQTPESDVHSPTFPLLRGEPEPAQQEEG